MVHVLSYTQQKEVCVCVLCCMCCHIHNKKRSGCTMVHVLSYTQQKDKCVYHCASVVIYPTKREV